MKKEKKTPKFNDEELYSQWIDEIYESGQMNKYIDFNKPLDEQRKKYSIAFNQSKHNILIGIRLDKRIIDFVKKYSLLKGMTYQSIIKDWIANGYLSSMANLHKFKANH
ncbi:hypothetical protein HZB07_06030 [Candidatus Saganbacteria bacterium]|nr:hypothetical protein [Candidatus Saganbacteria bacterium]